MPLSSLLPVKQQDADEVLPNKKTKAEHNIIHKSTSTNESGLTKNQQLKQDAMLWAEFLYSEYKREKALLGEAQTKPTHYDKSNT